MFKYYFIQLLLPWQFKENEIKNPGLRGLSVTALGQFSNHLLKDSGKFMN